MPPTPAYSASIIGAPIDKTGVLEQVNPRKDVDLFLLNLLGLSYRDEYNAQNQKTTVLRRITRPLFTYEYAIMLQRDLLPAMSFTTQVSRWEREHIIRQIRLTVRPIIKSLAVHGDDNYVSPRTWARIEDYESMGVWRPREDGGVGIAWKRDMPVTYRMLELTRDLDEEAEQSLEMQKLISQIIQYIFASLNKGYASDPSQVMGMFPSMLGEVIRETQTMQGVVAPRATPAQGGQEWT